MVNHINLNSYQTLPTAHHNEEGEPNTYRELMHPEQPNHNGQLYLLNVTPNSPSRAPTLCRESKQDRCHEATKNTIAQEGTPNNQIITVNRIFGLNYPTFEFLAHALSFPILSRNYVNFH